MSFSSEVKEELSKIENLANKEMVKKELIGYLLSSNVVVSKNKIKFSTENEYNINRFSKLLNNINILAYNIEVQDKIYTINFQKKEIQKKLKELLLAEETWIELKEDIDQLSIKSIARGIFLGAGAISNPQKTYHLDIGLNTEQIANKICKNLQESNIKLRIIKKKNNYHIYTKDGEEISKYLAFIGANKAVLKFEEIRVEREMKNKINRIVNCEEANLNKTINASIAQIEAIIKLKENGKFEKLEKELKEVAEIRLKNPNASLIEIGKMLKNPIGKSGVNYRLKKILDLANIINK